MELYPSHQEVNVPIDEIEFISPFTDFQTRRPLMNVHMKDFKTYTTRTIEPYTQKQQMTPGEILTYNHRDYQTFNVIIFKDSPLERTVTVVTEELHDELMDAGVDRPILYRSDRIYHLSDEELSKSTETVAHIIEHRYFPTEYAQYSEFKYRTRFHTDGQTYIFKGTKHERHVTFHTIDNLYTWSEPFNPKTSPDTFIIPNGQCADYHIIRNIELQALKRYNIVLD